MSKIILWLWNLFVQKIKIEITMLVTYICMFWHLLLSFFDELLLKIKKKVSNYKITLHSPFISYFNPGMI